MADVFISYAREDRDMARALAKALEVDAYSVWWDRQLLGGENFDEAIERELDLAKCVIVLWSRHSVSSDWVKNEAAAAAERGVLVPAYITDAVKLPLQFRRKHTIDLASWRGDANDPELDPMRRAIAAHLRRELPLRTPSLLTSSPRALRLGLVVAVCVAVGLAIVIGNYLIEGARNKRVTPPNMPETKELLPASTAPTSDSSTAQSPPEDAEPKRLDQVQNTSSASIARRTLWQKNWLTVNESHGFMGSSASPEEGGGRWTNREKFLSMLNALDLSGDADLANIRYTLVKLVIASDPHPGGETFYNARYTDEIRDLEDKLKRGIRDHAIEQGVDVRTVMD